MDHRGGSKMKAVAFLTDQNINRELRSKGRCSLRAIEGDELATKSVFIAFHVFIVELDRVEQRVQSRVCERSQRGWPWNINLAIASWRLDSNGARNNGGDVGKICFCDFRVG